MISLKKLRPKKESVANKEVFVSKFLPYLYHWNNNTIIGNDYEFYKVIKLDGFSHETAGDADLEMRNNIRNMLWKGLSGNITLHFHTIRRRQNIFQEDIPNIDPNIKIPLDFAKYVDLAWKKKNESCQAYVNELYITVVYKGGVLGAEFLDNLFKNFKKKTDPKGWANNLKESYEELEEIISRIMNSFRDYSPRILGTRTKNGIVYSELLEFLGTIVNCGHSQPIALSTGKISKILPNTRLFFGSKSMEARTPRGNKFAGLVSIKEYGPYTYAGLLDNFLQLPFEFIISQSFKFSNRQLAIQQMQLHQNRMIQSEDKAVSQVIEISQALDMAMSGDISFGKHHLTILCMADSLKQLETYVSMASNELTNCGATPVREKPNLECAYWAQLPGNEKYIVRKSTINTLNLAGFASMHNFPTGKRYGNHWGEAVTVFNTTSGTPYYFSFHVRDVGHTTIIGPTGAGKTVLMNFLCAQAQKFGGRTYFFDKDRGAEIFIRALNGNYTIINPNIRCGFNPLQLPDTSQNRTFLLDWFKLLVTVNGENLTAEDIAIISQAIDGNYKLDPKDRVLRNVAPFFGIGGPGTIAGRLEAWHGKGSHAAVFDNDIDTMDLTKNNVFGFEMAELLRDSISLGPVLLYIFHRINISLDGTPTMIVLDEAWALIDNKIFAPKIKDWLKVLRKLNTFVVFATQSVEDASKSNISDTLIQQTATQIFLPNLKATSVYKTAFMLTDREYLLIKNTDPASRFFLIKQGINAVIARIELSGLENIINVLSGRTETVILLDRIRKEVGDDPKKWLPVFYKRVKEMHD